VKTIFTPSERESLGDDGRGATLRVSVVVNWSFEGKVAMSAPGRNRTFAPASGARLSTARESDPRPQPPRPPPNYNLAAYMASGT